MVERDAEQVDPLDELLAAARWPAMPADADTRLRRRWAGMSQARWGAMWMRYAAAAVVVVAAGVWVGVATRQGEGVKVVITETVKVEHVSFGREARPAEMAVAMTAMRRHVPKTESAVARRAFVDVEGCLNGIEKKKGAALALRRLREEPDRERVVAVLFARLDDPKVGVRLAAARALGYLDGPEVTARLARMVERNRNRREALAALIQSDGVEARDYLERARREAGIDGAVRSVEAQIKSF